MQRLELVFLKIFIFYIHNTLLVVLYRKSRIAVFFNGLLVVVYYSELFYL